MPQDRTVAWPAVVRGGDRRVPWAVLTVISVGGGLGGLARHGLGAWFPGTPGAFPWTTFAVNVSGCALIGVLMVLVTEIWPDRRLLRPFLGVGVLGGYTTFSLHMVEAYQLVGTGAVGTAAAYLVGTAVAGLVAVGVASVVTGRLVRRRSRWAADAGEAG